MNGERPALSSTQATDQLLGALAGAAGAGGVI